jgi:hypothetical protein
MLMSAMPILVMPMLDMLMLDMLRVDMMILDMLRMDTPVYADAGGGNDYDAAGYLSQPLELDR